MYNCGIIPLYYTSLPNHICIIQHKIETGTAIMFKIETTRSSNCYNEKYKSSASGCSSSALIADMKLNLKRTPLTRIRMVVVVVALMNLITLTYPRASTAYMTRICSRPRR